MTETIYMDFAAPTPVRPEVVEAEDLLQALVEAYIMEKGTREFYAQAASKSTAGEAKKSFAELAAWENGHMIYIQSLYQSILDDRELEGSSRPSARRHRQRSRKAGCRSRTWKKGSNSSPSRTRRTLSP